MTELTLEGLAEALNHSMGTHLVGDVVQQILGGTAQLWEEKNALIVTEVQQTPRLRVLHFWLATGELDAVIALHHKVMAWGRQEMACDIATLSGRFGWTRALADCGWRKALVLMERDLSDYDSRGDQDG